MKDTQNIWIAVLFVTAGILTAMLVTTYVQTQQPAYADTPARGGEYIAVTGAWSSSRDLLYLVDLVANRMNAYTINTNTDAIERVDSIDLKKVFQD